MFLYKNVDISSLNVNAFQIHFELPNSLHPVVHPLLQNLIFFTGLSNLH